MILTHLEVCHAVGIFTVVDSIRISPIEISEVSQDKGSTGIALRRGLPNIFFSLQLMRCREKAFLGKKKPFSLKKGIL